MNGPIRMILKCAAAVVLAGLVIVGCKSSQPASASSNGDMSAAAPMEGIGSGSSGGTRVEYIGDPSLNMNAIAVTIPAGWKFHSIFMQAGDCVAIPFAGSRG